MVVICVRYTLQDIYIYQTRIFMSGPLARAMIHSADRLPQSNNDALLRVSYSTQPRTKLLLSRPARSK